MCAPCWQAITSGSAERLERFGGTVEKFIGDAVVAVFGAPVVHEDDPERAVRAALAIRDAASHANVELRVAVNTGEALVSVDARPAGGQSMHPLLAVQAVLGPIAFHLLTRQLAERVIGFAMPIDEAAEQLATTILGGLAA